MTETAVAPPHGRYRRALADADFSLEANTESVPADGRYYILKGGEISLATEEFPEAIAEYNRLCRTFWEQRLEDETPQVRVSAAWGLLGLDPTDKTAQGVIQEFGTPQEKKRLEQAQSRRRALRSRAGASASKAPSG
jgi:hypothetical protein